MAFNAVQINDGLVCVDAGCNRLVLIDSSDMEYYLPAAAGSSLRTAQSGNHLVILGRVTIGRWNNVLHCPDASANLMLTYLITRAGATVLFGSDGPNCDQNYCDIRCVHPAVRGGGEKTISCRLVHQLFWQSIQDQTSHMLWEY